MLTPEQTKEKREWIGLLQAVNQLEVKGQVNISILFNIIDFVQKKIKDLDDIEKEGG